VRETKRARILWAMAQAVNDHGPEPVSVAQVIAIAGVSRKTFYELFDDRNHCLVAAIERAVSLATDAARGAYETDGRWVERMRAGLLALLEFFDAEPRLARLCVLHSAVAGSPAAIAYRGETLSRLVEVVNEGRASSRCQPSPVTAEGVVGGVLAIVHSRLQQPRPEALSALINPLTSFIVLPYLGVSAAETELSRPVPAPVAARAQMVIPDPLEGVNMRLTYRTMSVLSAIAVQPRLSNRAIGIRAGVTDQGQISKLLGRLAQLGLIVNRGRGHASGASNAWELTARGRKIERTVRRASLGAGDRGPASG
jgi:AcrR family transcriptional regulator/DNA-binding MarR family transcriptional regulator